jgi:hypothetical protein
MEAAMVPIPNGEGRKPNELLEVNDHHIEYFAAWAISGVMALATVLILWHFDI